MTFAPNTGYAFAVGSDTWHSADRIGPEVSTRDSILLTYFVDAGALRFLRNRGEFHPERSTQPLAVVRTSAIVSRADGGLASFFAEHGGSSRVSLPINPPLSGLLAW